MKNARATALVIAITAGLCTPAMASDLNNLGALNQAEFLALSKDLAAATSTKAIEPATPLSFTGFDVNASAVVTKTQAGAAWNKATGSGMDNLTQTKFSVSKGLSSSLDVGAFVSSIASSNASVAGIHTKYALLEGNAITPAIALRANYSQMRGVSQMSLNNTGLDLLISKGFVGFTPYVGVGTVYTSAKANGVAGLSNERFNQSKSFVGVSWNVLLLNLSAEYDRTGKNASVGLKAGLRF